MRVFRSCFFNDKTTDMIPGKTAVLPERSTVMIWKGE